MKIIKSIKKLYSIGLNYDKNKNVTNKEIKALKKEVNSLKNQNKTQAKAIESYNHLFNILFIDYNLKPKSLFQNTHELCNELLKFIGNICKKHGLEYWLDFGNLLGATRHKGFIPWDDDMDIGMMRKDYDILADILEEEIKNYNLSEWIDVSLCKINNNRNVVSFIQILLLDEAIFAGLDIFPYDFITDIDNYEIKFKEQRKIFQEKVLNGYDKKLAIEESFNDLNISKDKRNYIANGIEWNKPNIISYEHLFPLKSIYFYDGLIPCPNNVDEYLSVKYGKNYMKIPPSIRWHQRQNSLRKLEDVDEKYSYFIDLLKKINDEFE